MAINSSLLAANDVLVICSPLFKKLNLNAFSYSRVYADGSRAELWSDAYAMEHSFFVKKYIDKVYTPEYLRGDKVMLYENKIRQYPSRVKNIPENQICDQRNFFNHDCPLLVTENHGEYVEYFFFYTPRENIDAVNVYFNHIDELRRFCNYFKKRAVQIIQAASRDRLILPWRNIESQSNAHCQYLKGIDLPTLSKKETQVAYMVVEGKTAKEIAKLLNISYRTVEHHIAYIKEKFNCNKKSELISKLINNLSK